MKTDRVIIEAMPNTLSGRDWQVHLVVGGVSTDITHLVRGFTLHAHVDDLNKCDLKMIPVEVISQ